MAQSRAGSPRSTAAGVGGASSGTLLLAIAHQVGQSTLLGELLTYSAPTVAVVAGWLALFLKGQASLWNERWTVRQAVKTLMKQLDSPNVSDDHKAKVRQLLDAVHQSAAEAELERVKASGLILGRSRI